jgi:hypothetical protein
MTNSDFNTYRQPRAVLEPVSPLGRVRVCVHCMCQMGCSALLTLGQGRIFPRPRPGRALLWQGSPATQIVSYLSVGFLNPKGVERMLTLKKKGSLTGLGWAIGSGGSYGTDGSPAS